MVLKQLANKSSHLTVIQQRMMHMKIAIRSLRWKPKSFTPRSSRQSLALRLSSCTAPVPTAYFTAVASGTRHEPAKGFESFVMLVVRDSMSASHPSSAMS